MSQLQVRLVVTTRPTYMASRSYELHVVTHDTQECKDLSLSLFDESTDQTIVILIKCHSPDLMPHTRFWVCRGHAGSVIDLINTKDSPQRGGPTIGA